MAWPKDELQEKFYKALMTLQEVRGEEEAIRILEEELERARVVKEYRENRHDLAEAAAREARLTARLHKAVHALGFYADEDNYSIVITESRALKPLYEEDRGARARATLAEIAAEGEQPEDE